MLSSLHNTQEHKFINVHDYILIFSHEVLYDTTPSKTNSHLLSYIFRGFTYNMLQMHS